MVQVSEIDDQYVPQLRRRPLFVFQPKNTLNLYVTNHFATVPEGPVFLSPAGTAWTVDDNAGLPKDLVLYLARHECGTKICREKGIEYARRLLGHANISTTQRYMHLDERELADAQDLVE
jgi:hypothetical protein